MNEVEKLLRDDGYKFTNPRRIVARVIEEKKTHLTANEIWENVQAIDESIGRMTVYRTLDLFTRLGYIRPASQSATDARSGIVYILMEDGHHHHIICQECNSIIEFDECDMEALVQVLEDKYACKINGHLLEFYGTCESCLASLNN